MNKAAEITISYQPATKSCTWPIIASSKEAYDILLPHYKPATIHLQEQFVIAFLSRNNRVKGVYPGFFGGISGTVVDIRIILAIALKSASSAIILSHNHPSGNMNPSEADIQLTRKVGAACTTMDITLLDHIIISPQNSFYSFSDNCML